MITSRLLLNILVFRVTYENTFAFTRSQALQMIQNKSQGEMIDTIISKFKTLEEAYDFTVVEGSDFVGEGIAFEFERKYFNSKKPGCSCHHCYFRRK